MKRIKKLLIFSAVILLFALFLYEYNERINNRVTVTDYSFSHPKIPSSFEGYKIMLISDLHNAYFSRQIIMHIENEKPDIIAFCGDMVQLPDDNLDETLKIVNAAGDIPVYAVSGNHERQCGSYEEICEILWASGVEMLENNSIKLRKGNDVILLAGIKDPRHDIITDEKLGRINNDIKDLIAPEKYFSILLSHRADIYPGIKDSGTELILSGHMHGGIIRLPFVGGIIGKDGKYPFLPDYEYGVVKEGDSATMIVSGGCDKNPQKKRYFNQPEILLVTLKGE